MSDTAGRVTGRGTWDAAHPAVACGDSEVLAGTGHRSLPRQLGRPPSPAYPLSGWAAPASRRDLVDLAEPLSGFRKARDTARLCVCQAPAVRAPGPTGARARQWPWSRGRPFAALAAHPSPSWVRLSHKCCNPVSVLKVLPCKEKRTQDLKRTQVDVCVCCHGTRFNCIQM